MRQRWASFRGIAVVQHVTETEAGKEIEGRLAKSSRRGAKAGSGGRGDAAVTEVTRSEIEIMGARSRDRAFLLSLFLTAG